MIISTLLDTEIVLKENKIMTICCLSRQILQVCCLFGLMLMSVYASVYSSFAYESFRRKT